jgi:hypothetical protein
MPLMPQSPEGAPIARAIPRFIANASAEGLPYGRHAQQLREEFAKACEPHTSEAGGPPGELTWYPERTWGGRGYVPATAPVEGAPVPSEYFGYVSFARAEDGGPSDMKAVADFTDVIAADNPDWKIDLNEEVIGPWNGGQKRTGDVTLVWGTPMVPDAVAATAVIDGDVVDQASVTDERFTLIAVDALKGFPVELYVEIFLWGKRQKLLARESLYDAPE